MTRSLAPSGAAAETVGLDDAAPWTIVDATEHHGVYIEDVAGRTVCDLYALDDKGKPRSHHDAGKRAALIAAAPDLFAALHSAQASLDELLDYSGGADSALVDPYVVERAQFALAAARAALSAVAAATDGGRG